MDSNAIKLGQTIRDSLESVLARVIDVNEHRLDGDAARDALRSARNHIDCIRSAYHPLCDALRGANDNFLMGWKPDYPEAAESSGA